MHFKLLKVTYLPINFPAVGFFLVFGKKRKEKDGEYQQLGLFVDVYINIYDVKKRCKKDDS